MSQRGAAGSKGGEVVDLQLEMLRRLVGRTAERRLSQLIEGRMIEARIEDRQRRQGGAADDALPSLELTPAPVSAAGDPGGFSGLARLYGPFTR